MRKSLIRWVLLAVIVLGIIIGGPIIINEFYRNNSGYMTIWGAADVLTYYGAIIAASGAAIGVYCSIRYSHKQYREDKRRDVLPYFAINILGRKCVSPFDLGWYGEDDVREEDKAKEALTYREFKLVNTIDKEIYNSLGQQAAKQQIFLSTINQRNILQCQCSLERYLAVFQGLQNSIFTLSH